jgi:hypothetical protein
MKKDLDWQVCRGLPTRCYRNLNTGLMSLTQQIDKSWIVVGHTDNLVIIVILFDFLRKMIPMNLGKIKFRAVIKQLK